MGQNFMYAAYFREVKLNFGKVKFQKLNLDVAV